MKLGSIKTTLAVSVLGLTTLFGASEINAQTRQQNGNFPPQSNGQNQKIERQDDIRIQNNRDSYGRDDSWNKNGRDERGWERNARYKIYQNGKVFVLDGRELEMLKQTILRGYEEGFQKGKFDSRNKKRGGYYGSNIYQNSNYGYQNDGKFGSKNSIDSRLMQFYFQKGFEEGYQDGFNTRKHRGWERDDKGLSQRELREILRYERF